MLYGRDYLVAGRPHERGIVIYTLHHAAEIRSIDTVEELTSVATTVKPEEMKLARQVIATFDGPLDLADYKDEYREGLQRIIDAKIAGEEIVEPDHAQCPRIHRHSEQVSVRDTEDTGQNDPRHARMRDDCRAAARIGRNNFTQLARDSLLECVEALGA